MLVHRALCRSLGALFRSPLPHHCFALVMAFNTDPKHGHLYQHIHEFCKTWHLNSCQSLTRSHMNTTNSGAQSPLQVLFLSQLLDNRAVQCMKLNYTVCLCFAVFRVCVCSCLYQSVTVCLYWFLSVLLSCCWCNLGKRAFFLRCQMLQSAKAASSNG